MDAGVAEEDNGICIPKTNGPSDRTTYPACLSGDNGVRLI